jgi:ELWxxDGT repeat protein
MPNSNAAPTLVPTEQLSTVRDRINALKPQDNGKTAQLLEAITAGRLGPIVTEPDTNIFNLTPFGNRILFTASSTTAGTSTLWTTDGTQAGTAVLSVFDSASLAGAKVFQGELYFGAEGAGLGTEIWKTDGIHGTTLVKDLAPGSASSYARGFNVVGNQLLFAATDQANFNGLSLWKTDGTTDGTQSIKPDIQPFAFGQEVVNLNGSQYFVAGQAATGLELWKSDGTTAGTVLIKDILPGPSTKSLINPDLTFFVPYAPSNLTLANDRIFFTMNDGGVNGEELWQTDGTTAGTMMVADLYPGLGRPNFSTKGVPGDVKFIPEGNSSAPRDLVFVDNILYFTADDGNGRKLYQLPVEPGKIDVGPTPVPPPANDGDDIVYGTIGDDKINVGNGWNRVYASEGRNFVQSGSGDDGIYGGSGTDVILAGAGRNEIYAGEGLNLVVTGNGYDQIYGGAGTDIVIAGDGFNAIYAGEGNNLVIGGNDGNHVYLGAGNDLVKTGSGNDTIYAGNGNNYIDAGAGWNHIDLGSGIDRVVLHQGDGFDIVNQFDLAHDRLGLVDGMTVGDLSVRQINESWGYLTEISVTRTGDVLVQLQGMHTTLDQITFESITAPGSGFKQLAASVFDNSLLPTADRDLLKAGIAAGHLDQH